MPRPVTGVRLTPGTGVLIITGAQPRIRLSVEYDPVFYCIARDDRPVHNPVRLLTARAPPRRREHVSA